MSIKEQVEFAKEELTQDEKLLAGLIKAERFFKRNKVMIMTLVVLIVVGGSAYAVIDYLKDQRLLEANRAFLVLQANPSDVNARKTLEEKNPPLAILFKLKEAIASGDVATLKKFQKSDDFLIADLAFYHTAAYEKSAQGFDRYRMRSQTLLKDFATLESAYLQMLQNRIDKAKSSLSTIGKNSPIAPVAQMLRHYGIVKAKAKR